MPQFVTAVMLVFTCSLVLSCIFFIMRRPILKMQNFRNDLSAVQAVHSVSTPRTGGVAIITALVVGLISWADETSSVLEHSKFMVTVVPVF